MRKFARELGVPLAEVKGSGLKGRITDADVQSFTRSVMSGAVQTLAAQQGAKPAVGGGGSELGLIPWPKVDFAKFGPIERKEMSRIKKISGANLLRNAIMIPAVTNHDDCDITDLEAFRVSTNKENEKSGVKVTMLAFLIKACVAALKKYPEFNSSLDGDALIYKQYFHIGFAADTPNGLMVPVIKDADKKGIFQISQEMGDLAKKARDGKLEPGRDDRCQLHHQQPGRHWRALFHAHHQCARSRDSGRLPLDHRTHLGWQGVPAAFDAAAVPDLGPPRHRRRCCGTLQRLSGPDPRRFPQGPPVILRVRPLCAANVL